MNTGRQILIDRSVVKWAAQLMNILVTIAGKFFPKNHDLSLPFKTIAVCKFKGLGSIVQSTPLLQTLRTQYPGARIIYVSSKANEKILEKIDIIDEVIILNDKNFSTLLKGFIPFIYKLFKRHIDVYIDLEVYSNFSSLVTSLTNAQNRFGFYLKESNYRMGIYTHMMYYNNAVHVYQTYLQWARLLNCKNISGQLYAFNSGIDVITINHKPLHLPATEYFVINPNASDLRVERRWPAENFRSLLIKLVEAYPRVKFLLIGAPSEKEYVATIAKELPPGNVVNLAGATTIDELIAVIRHAAMVITNDTGPMHLAFALNKKTVALFGPCSPDQYGHYTNTVALYKKVYCSPCVHEFRIPPCLGNNQCMQMISVEEVLNAIQTQYNTPAGKDDAGTEKLYTSGNTVLGIMKRKTY